MTISAVLSNIVHQILGHFEFSRSVKIKSKYAVVFYYYLIVIYNSALTVPLY